MKHIKSFCILMVQYCIFFLCDHVNLSSNPWLFFHVWSSYQGLCSKKLCWGLDSNEWDYHRNSPVFTLGGWYNFEQVRNTVTLWGKKWIPSCKHSLSITGNWIQSTQRRTPTGNFRVINCLCSNTVPLYITVVALIWSENLIHTTDNMMS